MKSASEAAFESAIESAFLTDGYSRVDAKRFDRECAIFPDEALSVELASRFDPITAPAS
jgi:type I restriction enzyme R subunit